MNERLNELRKSLKLTLKEFGKRLGVTDAAISRLEKGERKLTEQMVKSICREFNVNEQWLRYGTGEMFQPVTRYTEIAKLTKTLLDEEEDSFKNRLISVLANLTEEQWGLLADIAEKIVKEKD